jgi:hypothetical protein
MARPKGSVKYSTDAIIEALQKTNGLISLAARNLQCSPTTIRIRMKEVQKVRQVVDESRNELADLAELALRHALIRGEPWAVAMVLKSPIARGRGYREENESGEINELVFRVIRE